MDARACAIVLGLTLTWAAGGRAAPAPERIETERAVLEYQPGTLDLAAARAFAELLDRGIRDIETLVGPCLPADKRRQERVRYVATERVEISHAYRRTVMLPLERVRTRSAPYLHETTHVLVRAGNDCAWLNEGLASYVESRVSEELGGYDAHVFSQDGNRGIDAAARRHLGRAAGREMLEWIGACGTPPELETERERVAAPFYVLSQSFVKYLSAHAGLEAVVQASLDAAPEAALQRATGRTLADWKRDWQQALRR